MFQSVVYVIHNISSVYVSTPISQFLPFTPFPLGIHTFVLYVYISICFANKVIYTIFLDSTHMH